MKKNNYKPSEDWTEAELRELLWKLVNSSNNEIRLKIAENGYGLERFINDTDPEIRAAVAEYGYGLDALIEDEDEYVQDTVIRTLNRMTKEEERKLKKLQKSTEFPHIELTQGELLEVLEILGSLDSGEK